MQLTHVVFIEATSISALSADTTWQTLCQFVSMFAMPPFLRALSIPLSTMLKLLNTLLGIFQCCMSSKHRDDVTSQTDWRVYSHSIQFNCPCSRQRTSLDDVIRIDKTRVALATVAEHLPTERGLRRNRGVHGGKSHSVDS